MKWSNVKLIFLREFRDQLRDRRTIFTIAVLPLLLYPLLGMSFLQVSQFMREHPSRVWIVNAGALPENPSLLQKDQFVADFAPDAEARLLQLTVDQGTPLGTDRHSLQSLAQQAIRSGKYEAVVYFPDDFAERLEAVRRPADAAGDADAAKPAEVPEPELFVNRADDKSRIASNRVETVLNRWRRAIVRDNLQRNSIPVAAAEPFEVQGIDVAEEQNRRAAIWSKILPFVVLIWALTGAFYPAIDLCAGEKERGTLETLLSSPAERSEIVWGKMLTVMSFSMATSLLNMASLGFTGMFIVQQLPLGGAASFGAPPIWSMGWLVLALIPISALFSALSLAIAAFARSSKEGQYYLMPLLLITLPLMVLPMLPAANLDLGTSLIPVTGLMLLLRSLIESHYSDALLYAPPVIGVTCGCCLLAIRWAIDQFNNESVLFRETERWGLGLWVRHVVRDRGATPSVAEALACGVLLLVIRFFASFAAGMPATFSQFAVLQAVTLIALIGTPAVLMAVMLTRSPRHTLLLHRTRPITMAAALLLAVALHPSAMALAQAVRWLYPMSEGMTAQLQQVGQLLEQAPNVWTVLLLIAVLPAICEELAFRGFILSGLRHLGHKWAAIAISSVFFGITHGVLQQSMSAVCVGLVIGYVAVQTRSLWPCILFHLVFNSISVLMGTTLPGWLDQASWMSWVFVEMEQGVFTYRPLVIFLSGAVAVGLLFWFQRLPFEPTSEEQLQAALDHPQDVVLPSTAYAGSTGNEVESVV